jgi:hypothetical protein
MPRATSEGDTFAIPATLNVVPALFLSSQALVFRYNDERLPPPSQTISIDSNLGSAAFSITTSAGWLFATPYNGTLPASLRISVSPAFLSPGDYTGTVTIKAGPDGLTSTVTVTLKVGPQPPA